MTMHANTTTRVASKAEDAIQATRQAANQALDKLQEGVSDLQDRAPSAIQRAATRIDEATQAGIERARDARDYVKEQALVVGEKTVGHVRDEPVKSMLMAAAAGAAVATLIGWLARGRGPRD